MYAGLLNLSIRAGAAQAPDPAVEPGLDDKAAARQVYEFLKLLLVTRSRTSLSSATRTMTSRWIFTTLTACATRSCWKRKFPVADWRILPYGRGSANARHSKQSRDR